MKGNKYSSILKALAVLCAFMLVVMGGCLQTCMIKARIAPRFGAPAMLHTFAPRLAAAALAALRCSVLMCGRSENVRKTGYASISVFAAAFLAALIMIAVQPLPAEAGLTVSSCIGESSGESSEGSSGETSSAAGEVIRGETSEEIGEGNSGKTGEEIGEGNSGETNGETSEETNREKEKEEERKRQGEEEKEPENRSGTGGEQERKEPENRSGTDGQKEKKERGDSQESKEQEKTGQDDSALSAEKKTARQGQKRKMEICSLAGQIR